ncbi:MAG TPA: hypothetical protein VM253_06985 [Candidatus Limnocylindrales bacterium]|nr:hypothetical protein [Candidatus Limnocylindrales bacterium]
MARPSERPEADERPEAGDSSHWFDGLDLLTVGLLVFFVALIAIVGAMLFLPAVV